MKTEFSDRWVARKEPDLWDADGHRVMAVQILKDSPFYGRVRKGQLYPGMSFRCRLNKEPGDYEDEGKEPPGATTCEIEECPCRHKSPLDAVGWPNEIPFERREPTRAQLAPYRLPRVRLGGSVVAERGIYMRRRERRMKGGGSMSLAIGPRYRRLTIVARGRDKLGAYVDVKPTCKKTRRTKRLYAFDRSWVLAG